MRLHRLQILLFFLFIVFFIDAAHASLVVSGDALAMASIGCQHKEQRGAGRRQLLQILKPCQVPFQEQNYTIITSKCKGPDYRVNACCSALVEFACPFASEINDNTTDCASVMFSYINLYGSYPAGLFANLCVGDQNGLPCPLAPAAAPKASLAFPNKQRCSRLFWILLLSSLAMILDFFN